MRHKKLLACAVFVVLAAGVPAKMPSRNALDGQDAKPEKSLIGDLYSTVQTILHNERDLLALDKIQEHQIQELQDQNDKQGSEIEGLEKRIDELELEVKGRGLVYPQRDHSETTN